MLATWTADGMSYLFGRLVREKRKIAVGQGKQTGPDIRSRRRGILGHTRCKGPEDVLTGDTSTPPQALGAPGIPNESGKELIRYWQDMVSSDEDVGPKSKAWLPRPPYRVSSAPRRFRSGPCRERRWSLARLCGRAAAGQGHLRTRESARRTRPDTLNLAPEARTGLIDERRR